MKKCSYCGRDNPADATSCRECGTEFEQVTTPPSEESHLPEFSNPVRSTKTSDSIKSVASLEVSEAKELGALIQKENIPFEVRVVTEESGLEFAEILVVEIYFERACEISEEWQTGKIEERARRHTRCPQCHSPNLERNPHDKLEPVLRCKNCGYTFSI